MDTQTLPPLSSPDPAYASFVDNMVKLTRSQIERTRSAPQPILTTPQAADSLRSNKRVLLRGQTFYLSSFQTTVIIESVNGAPVRVQMMSPRWGHVVRRNVFASSIKRLRDLHEMCKAVSQ